MVADRGGGLRQNGAWHLRTPFIHLNATSIVYLTTTLFEFFGTVLIWGVDFVCLGALLGAAQQAREKETDGPFTS